jgi:hypothetical protein
MFKRFWSDPKSSLWEWICYKNFNLLVYMFGSSHLIIKGVWVELYQMDPSYTVFPPVSPRNFIRNPYMLLKALKLGHHKNGKVQNSKKKRIKKYGVQCVWFWNWIRYLSYRPDVVSYYPNKRPLFHAAGVLSYCTVLLRS